jgi:hypothetical protein
MARVRRGLLSAADVIQEELQAAGVGYRAALVTATYRPGVAWGARHIAATLKCLREWARRRRIWVKYVWRSEPLKRLSGTWWRLGSFVELRSPCKAAAELFRLHKERLVLTPEWQREGWIIKADAIVDPEGVETNPGLLRGYALILAWAHELAQRSGDERDVERYWELLKAA